MTKFVWTNLITFIFSGYIVSSPLFFTSLVSGQLQVELAMLEYRLTRGKYNHKRIKSEMPSHLIFICFHPHSIIFSSHHFILYPSLSPSPFPTLPLPVLIPYLIPSPSWFHPLGSKVPKHQEVKGIKGVGSEVQERQRWRQIKEQSERK